MNTYWLNSGGKREKVGEARDESLAGADAVAIGMYGNRPLTDPTGGRAISVGRVWVERTGSRGWMPLVYVSNTGQRPPASDAPSALGEYLPWIIGAAAAAAAYFLS